MCYFWSCGSSLKKLLNSLLVFPGYAPEYVEPSTAQDQRYSFITEWYDPHAALIRRYQFLFYPNDNSIEMFDIKNRRKFLNRTKFENITKEDMYIGNKVNVYSRQLTFVDFGDKFTEKKIGSKNEKTLAIIKPDAVNKLGTILHILHSRDIAICHTKMINLSRNDAKEFYQEHSSKPFFNVLVDFMSSGPIVAMELMGSNVIEDWRNILGPTNSAEAREIAPNTLRAKFGSDNTKNAAHGSDSEKSANREIDFFFGGKGRSRFSSTAQLQNSTCCVIKPHAVKAGITGNIVQVIEDAGFKISALNMLNVEKVNCEEFYEVYKGVVAEYQGMVAELCSGPCVAMEITGKESETPKELRKLCGPADPEIARHLRPKTIRAMFGKDKIHNAVHCTDLPEDGILEVEYFFRILDN